MADIKKFLDQDGVTFLWQNIVKHFGEHFDPKNYELPILYLEGDITDMTKENAVDLTASYWEKQVLNAGENKTWVNVKNDTCSVKWQGSSSLAYEKKNYTIKFSEAFEVVPGWGAQKKYCLKANFIDHTQARNIISAKIWGQIVKSRPNLSSNLKSLPNYGAVDGFPIIIMLNNKFHGLYTWNIPKDGWMFGMKNSSTEAIVGADGSTALDVAFKGETKLDGNGMEFEYAQDEENIDWIINSLNTMINACINSDGSDLDTVISQYLDLDSVIDYLLFTTFIGGFDMLTRNYLLATYDGIKWHMSAYDMDSTYGLKWDGKTFFDALDGPAILQYKNKHLAMDLVYRFKTDAIRKRWAQLRNGVLSLENIHTLFENFISLIPEEIYNLDRNLWKSIPSTEANSLDQILRWVKERLIILDNEVMGLPEQEIPNVPIGDNLYSTTPMDVWGDGYFYDSAATLDLETLEITNTTTSSNFYTTKAIKVKPLTTYLIPNITWDSKIVTYNIYGKQDGAIKAIKLNQNYSRFTTKATTEYVLFSFWKPSYSDYNNFYVKEQIVDMSNGLSELWNENYYYDDKAEINLNTLELKAAYSSQWYKLSKAIQVNPNSKYAIPLNYGSATEIKEYDSNGVPNGTLTTKSIEQNYTIITTKETTNYLLFVFDKTYDINNFFIMPFKNIVVENNLYNGLSTIWGDGRFFSDDYDLNTNANVLELKGTVAADNGNYCISKAIPCEPNTKYYIPNSALDTEIRTYGESGVYNGTIANKDDYATITTDENGQRYVTTNEAAMYMACCFMKPRYPDYENFFVVKA